MLAEVFPIGNDLSHPNRESARGDTVKWAWDRDIDSVLFPIPRFDTVLAMLMVNKYLAEMLPESVRHEFDAILPRVQSHLTEPDQKEIVAHWSRNVRFVASHFALKGAPLAAEVRAAIFNGFTQGRQVEVTYKSLSGKEQVLPLSLHGIVYKPPNVYALATAFNYSDVRAYSLHRMENAKVLATPQNGIGAFDIDSVIAEGGLAIAEGEPCKVTIKVHDKSLIRFFRENRMGDDQTVEVIDEETGAVSATVQPSRVFIGWLASLGPAAEVLEPAHVRQELAEFLHAAASRYVSHT
jgi:predicted DNA-binding transcriptional regulator YafY